MNDDQNRKAVSWAAATIANRGAMLHAVPNGWDVQMPNGSWRACNSVTELCDVARELTATHRPRRAPMHNAGMCDD